MTNVDKGGKLGKTTHMKTKEKVKLPLRFLVLLKNMPRNKRHEVYKNIDRFKQVINHVEQFGGIATVTKFCVKFKNGVAQLFREDVPSCEEDLWFNKI